MAGTRRKTVWTAAAALAAGTTLACSGARAAEEAGTLNAQYAALQAQAGAPAAAPAAWTAVPAPVAPATQAVSLAHRVVNAAAAYEGWMRRAGDLGDAFDGDASVRSAIGVAAAYHAGQFEQGQVAYVALIALQDPRFVEGVRAWMAGAGTQGVLLETLTADPASVLEAPGVPGAARFASAALRTSAERVLAVGGRMRQAAYTIQRQSWSQATAPEAQARLAAVKVQSAATYEPSAGDVAVLLKAATAGRSPATPAEAGPLSAPVSPVVTRGLALAALALAGAAGEENADRLDVLLVEPRSADCARMAKLNLFQCLAVAGPEYEHVFCLGEHALKETAQCVAQAAGPAPIAAPTSAPAVTQVATAATSVMIPIAGASSDAAEAAEAPTQAPVPKNLVSAAPAPAAVGGPAGAPARAAAGPAAPRVTVTG